MDLIRADVIIKSYRQLVGDDCCKEAVCCYKESLFSLQNYLLQYQTSGKISIDDNFENAIFDIQNIYKFFSDIVKETV